MHQILRTGPLAILLTILGFVLLPLSATAADVTDELSESIRQITGKVTDAKTGEPLIAVTVSVVGTTTGAVTDFDGNYTISAQPSDSLKFTYVGYQTQTFAVGDRSTIDVVLGESVATIETVTVRAIGYGTQSTRDLSGAISSVDSETLKELPAQGLDQALQGRAAGVQVTQNSGAPGGAVSIRIRGIGSTLTAEPLYVIDGVPVVNDNSVSRSQYDGVAGEVQASNTLNTINPNDIESIEILKDASATAIYGSRGANGVVLITTKRGSKGKTKIALESYIGRQELARKVPVLDLRQYAQYYRDIGYRDIEEFQDLSLLGKGTDWQDEIFRTAYNRNAQLTLSGGSDRTQFAITGGFTRTEGIVIGSAFNRFSARFNLDHQISDRVRVGQSLQIARTKENITFNDNSRGVVFSALTYAPAVPVRNADGSFAAPQDEIELTFTNPVSRALETDDVNRKTRIIGNFYFEADLIGDLKYRTEFGTDLLFAGQSTFQPGYVRGRLTQQSSLRISKNENRFWVNKHLLTYNKTLNDNHRFDALLGFEAQEGGYEGIILSRNNLANNENIAINLGDAGQQQTAGFAGDNGLVSYFGRFNYFLSDRYQFTATFRADGSSNFGPRNRYGYFPSGAFAWRISDEKFMQGFDNLDNFKLRLGYGVTGNQNIPGYSFFDLLTPVTVVAGDGISTVLAPSNIANEGVKWETNYQTNLGIDLSFYNNRVSITADVYNRRSVDNLLRILLPETTGGLSAPFVNIGEINNQGVELTVNTTNWLQKNGGKGEWTTSFNFTRATNEVVDLGSTGSLVASVEGLVVSRTEEGQPIGQFYGYKVDRIFQDGADIAESAFQSVNTRPGDIKFQDLNNDGVIDVEDQTVIGNPLPDFTANINNRVRYKNFDLNFLFQGVFGNELLNLVRRVTDRYEGFGNQSIRALDAFTSENRDTDQPRYAFFDPNGNTRISDRFVEDGSFVRLKNVSLGYTIPQEKLRKLGMTNLRIYISGQNLVTWTDYTGYDPEVGSFNQNPLINGVDNGRYPISRAYTFGLNANF